MKAFTLSAILGVIGSLVALSTSWTFFIGLIGFSAYIAYACNVQVPEWARTKDRETTSRTNRLVNLVEPPIYLIACGVFSYAFYEGISYQIGEIQLGVVVAMAAMVVHTLGFLDLKRYL